MILIAPTSYKGTIGARDAALAMAAGAVAAGFDDLDTCPVSDGGPGLIDSLSGAESCVERVVVQGPAGGDVVARVLVDGDEAVIESADACGLHLLSEYAPMQANTRGVGELILAAGSLAHRVVVGLGGSGTVDGGIGAAAAAGWRFLDRHGRVLDPRPAGLQEIAKIEAPDSPPAIDLHALADVETPLFGERGAARVFGPQKGASAEEAETLDAGLRHLAGIIERATGKNVSDLVGGGAAGGLGAGLSAFFDARLTPGSQWLFERLGVAGRVAAADAVITGEGCFDDQSALGKITGAVIEAAIASRKPVLLIAGRITTALPAGVHAVGSREVLTTTGLTTIVQRTLPRLLRR